VLDLGSGTGIASRWFANQGRAVIAVEGLEDNVQRSLYPAIKQDITEGPVVAPTDLCHCHEVVEHIAEEHLDNLLASLMNGRIILMTAAGPDQPGHHHVNLQPTTYWINHLTQRGCQYLEDDTQRIRKLASQEQAWHMARSGMLFFNPART
jgi:2-polyprenyl-3-methyl-5-hydroxy-6-metoxy-1,4-benzoquinol methylase